MNTSIAENPDSADSILQDVKWTSQDADGLTGADHGACPLVCSPGLPSASQTAIAPSGDEIVVEEAARGPARPGRQAHVAVEEEPLTERLKRVKIPRKYKQPFMNFMVALRALGEVKDLKPKEQAKRGGEIWKSMSPEDKQYYYKLSESVKRNLKTPVPPRDAPLSAAATQTTQRQKYVSNYRGKRRKASPSPSSRDPSGESPSYRSRSHLSRHKCSHNNTDCSEATTSPSSSPSDTDATSSDSETRAYIASFSPRNGSTYVWIGSGKKKDNFSTRKNAVQGGNNYNSTQQQSDNNYVGGCQLRRRRLPAATQRDRQRRPRRRHELVTRQRKQPALASRRHTPSERRRRRQQTLEYYARLLRRRRDNASGGH